jgi:hypothetical protein
MTRPILLLACSAAKQRHLKKGQARDIYVGTLFQAGMTWAEENDVEVLILSAKYGWITPETIIETYNQRRKNSDAIPLWPAGSGYYLGGTAYFGRAPERFKSLVPFGPLGEMVRATLALLKNPKLAKTLRQQKVAGITWWLFEWLRTGRHTKDELWVKLQEKFPDGHPKMRNTIDIQLTQKRIGDERDCYLRRDGKVFWLEEK